MTREEAIEWIKTDISRLPNTPTQNAHKEALNMAIKALEQEPCEIIHGCTYGGVSWGGTYKPQESKTGHWKKGKYTEDDIRYNDNSYKCSGCGRVVDFKENFCPNCGVCMKDCRTLDEFIEDSKE